jgi:hypothetical protein
VWVWAKKLKRHFFGGIRWARSGGWLVRHGNPTRCPSWMESCYVLCCLGGGVGDPCDRDGVIVAVVVVARVGGIGSGRWD